LTTLNNQKIIQGLISITDKGDHIFMDLIESAKFNKGKGKLYKGVAGNLVAFACKTSFEKAMKELYRLLQKHNLLTITQKHWVQNFLAETECLLTPKNHKF
jgi:hypothetical protein